MIEENDLIIQRREKLQGLRKLSNPYRNNFKRNALILDIVEQYGELSKSELESLDRVEVVIAGRMMSRRVMGKASFANIRDMSGQIQLYVKRDDLPEGDYNNSFKKWDVGDIIGACGVVMKTNKGELSIHVSSICLLSKSLQPLPEKFHGLTDQEACYRQRYIDLIMNEKTRETFKIRTKTIDFIREYLKKENFLEVETPMMHIIPGGATARPFVTHHNSLDMQLYLRIAPELYLKRLVVGGFERVFEINRSFRNEGLSTRHNPEFTMLEFYQAYADYEDLITLTEDLLSKIVIEICGSNEIQYQGKNYVFSKPFRRMTMLEAILKFNSDFTEHDLNNLEKLKEIAKNLKIPLEDSYGIGRIQLEIFEKTVESKLLSPTFITQYPKEVSPLARSNDDNPELTDRFELIVGGREIANGFSELNDPEDQKERFIRQVEDKDAGDKEAMHYDADYITALEYGMPPTAGEGIGIDRLVMLLTDSISIRDVILFPHMRTKN